MSASKKMLVEKPNLMWLALTAILVDLEVQSRVAMDMEHCRFLSGELAISGELKPILVFFDGERYWLANGFHRYHVYVKAGRKQIRAIVKPGGRTEAIIESARVNDNASKGKTPEDKKRSLRMLLEFPEWRNKPAKELCDYVGLSRLTVVKQLAEFDAQGGQLSEFIVRKDGSKQLRHRNNKRHVRQEATKKQGTRCRAWIEGKRVSLGSDHDEAAKQLDEITKAQESRRAEIRDIECVARKMLYRGIAIRAVSRGGHSRISAREIGPAVFVVMDVSDAANVFSAVGMILISRLRSAPDKRAVVLCYPKDAAKTTLDLIESARQLGIEFLTPEEFVASIKTDDDGAGSAVLA